MLAKALSKYHARLYWVHLLLTLGLILSFPIWVWATQPTTLFGVLPWALLLASTIGFCQNIGLIHQLAHILPPAPGKSGVIAARVIHAFGGLRYTSTRFAHLMHHRYLGTDEDPDRHGYQLTTTFSRRLGYLLLIGPLRAKWAPVDLQPLIAQMEAGQARRYHSGLEKDRWFLLGIHGALLLSLGVFYVPWFASLLLANVCSNAREMAEHGNAGGAAYVNLKPSLTGLLFFSTPGFWYHGDHHTSPSLHYFELPLASPTIKPKTDLPRYTRPGVIHYLLAGN